MTTTPPRPPGRHARQPAEITHTVDNLLDAFSARGLWLRILGGAIAIFAGVLIAAFGAAYLTSDGKPHEAGKVRQEAAAGTPAASPSAAPLAAGAGGTDSDPAALAYIRNRDAADGGHVTDVRWSGRFLRVYTDFGENDTGTGPVALCTATVGYLTAGGVTDPVVFVHARRSDNGFVVLANNTDRGRCATVYTK